MRNRPFGDGSEEPAVPEIMFSPTLPSAEEIEHSSPDAND